MYIGFSLKLSEFKEKSLDFAESAEYDLPPSNKGITILKTKNFNIKTSYRFNVTGVDRGEKVSRIVIPQAEEASKKK